MGELREYGIVTTIDFPLIDFGFTDFEGTPVTFALGDTQVSRNGAAFVNTANSPTHLGNGVYSLMLTAAEMQAARITVTVVDQIVPKGWEDQCIIIETYGHASAQHTLTALADVTLGRNLASVTGAAARSLLNAVRFLRNRWQIAGATLTVYEEDGSSAAWTAAITTLESDLVTGVEPT